MGGSEGECWEFAIWDCEFGIYVGSARVPACRFTHRPQEISLKCISTICKVLDAWRS